MSIPSVAIPSDEELPEISLDSMNTEELPELSLDESSEDLPSIDTADEELPSIDMADEDLPELSLDEEPQEPGMIDQIKQSVSDFVGKPEMNESSEYKTAIQESYDTIEAEKAELKIEEAKLDQEANLHRRKKAKDVEPTDLEETSWYDISGKQFTTESIAGYYNKRVAEMKADGSFTNKSRAKAKIYKEMSANGATTRDLQELGQIHRGVPTATELFGETIGKAPAVVKKAVVEEVIDPAERGALRTGLAIASVGTDISNMLGVDTGDSQKALDTTRGFLDGLEKSYEEEHGHKSFVQSATESIPLVASMAYNPTTVAGQVSWLKLAMVDGAYQYADGRANGFSKIQSGAQAVVAATVTGSVGKLTNTAMDIITEVARAGNQFKDFNKITDLPSKHQKQLRELQKINGWTDDEVVSLVKGYKEGTEAGEINAIDSIRLLTQNSHNPEGRKLFEESILFNRDAAVKFLDETNSRAKDFLTYVSKDSDLGSIIHSSTYTDSLNNKSINWGKAYDDAIAKEISPDSVVMKRLKANAETYNNYDVVYHGQLVKKGMNNKTSLLDEAKTLVFQFLEAKVGKALSKVLGTAFFMPFSMPKRLIDLTVKQVFEGKTGGINKSIIESLKKGNLDPKKLKVEIKKANAHMDDNIIDDVVESVIKYSQKGARTINKEKEAAVKAQETTINQNRIISESEDLTEELSDLGVDVSTHRFKSRADTQKRLDEMSKLKEDTIKTQEKKARVASVQEKIDSEIKTATKELNDLGIEVEDLNIFHKPGTQAYSNSIKRAVINTKKNNVKAQEAEAKAEAKTEKAKEVEAQKVKAQKEKAETKRKKEETAQKKKEEAQKEKDEAKKKREEAAQKKKEEAEAKRAEAKRKREEAAQKKKEEAEAKKAETRRKREEEQAERTRKQEESKEKAIIAKYRNRVSDLKLSSRDDKKDENAKKIAVLILKEAKIYRKAMEKKGVSMSLNEAKKEVATKVSKLIDNRFK